MKIRDIYGSPASGSSGSKTASRNRGGAYLRQRSIPTNPNTMRQTNVREALGSLTPQWSSVLTQEERDAWNLYASNVPVIDTLGSTIKLSGINHFVRSNAPRVQAGLGVIVTAPAVFNIGDTPTINSTTLGLADGLVLNGAVLTPASANDNVLVYIGRPTNAGVSYFRGPYRLQSVEGVVADDGTWAAEVPTSELDYTPALGQKVFFRIQASRVDGRLSADAQASTIIVA